MKSNRPRILFVGRSIGHFSYYDTVLASIIERGGRVELLLDKKWSSKWLRGIDRTVIENFTARYPSFRMAWLKRREDRFRSFIFELRELRTYRSYVTRPQTTPFYIKRWRAYLSDAWKARLDLPFAEAILKWPITGKILEWIEDLVPPDPAVTEFIKSRRPDLLICSPQNLRYSEEVEYAKAAKKLGIPVTALTISWDNLSTKGLFHIKPDLLYVWNAYQQADAATVHGLKPDEIRVTGSPFFDKWFTSPSDIIDRETFCRTVGLDPGRPILLYLGSSKNIATDETWFISAVYAKLKANEALADCQILVRPHPANAEIYPAIVSDEIKVWPEGGALPETGEDFGMMRASFAHCIGSLGINTSAMIDSVLADVPTFTVRVKQYKNTQSSAVHFQYLEESRAMYLCNTLRDFIGGLQKVRAGQDDKAGKRKKFAVAFARPNGLGRTAGDVVAEAALKLARAQRAKSEGAGQKADATSPAKAAS